MRLWTRWIVAGWRYVILGSDDLVLPSEWFADTDRLAQYEAYTAVQLYQGSIVKDVAEMRRAAFWEAQAMKRQPAKTLQFPERVSQR